MGQKNAALGDVAPPTRTVSQQIRFYTYNSREVEYLTTPNHVREDIDPDPAVIRRGLERSLHGPDRPSGARPDAPAVRLAMRSSR